ncbi:MAG: hypothetical protein QJR08_00620 [Bacillota bacterium]|nr:hypothetical protein [Bacillota bacterium]
MPPVVSSTAVSVESQHETPATAAKTAIIKSTEYVAVIDRQGRLAKDPIPRRRAVSLEIAGKAWWISDNLIQISESISAEAVIWTDPYQLRKRLENLIRLTGTLVIKRRIRGQYAARTRDLIATFGQSADIHELLGDEPASPIHPLPESQEIPKYPVIRPELSRSEKKRILAAVRALPRHPAANGQPREVAMAIASLAAQHVSAAEVDLRMWRAAARPWRDLGDGAVILRYTIPTIENAGQLVKVEAHGWGSNDNPNSFDSKTNIDHIKTRSHDPVELQTELAEEHRKRHRPILAVSRGSVWVVARTWQRIAIDAKYADGSIRYIGGHDVTPWGVVYVPAEIADRGCRDGRRQRLWALWRAVEVIRGEIISAPEPEKNKDVEAPTTTPNHGDPRRGMALDAYARAIEELVEAKTDLESALTEIRLMTMRTLFNTKSDNWLLALDWDHPAVRERLRKVVNTQGYRCAKKKLWRSETYRSLIDEKIALEQRVTSLSDELSRAKFGIYYAPQMKTNVEHRMNELRDERRKLMAQRKALRKQGAPTDGIDARIKVVERIVRELGRALERAVAIP